MTQVSDPGAATDAAIELVTAESIVEAAHGLEPVVSLTPLLGTRWLDDLKVGAEVRVKPENFQRTGAFKLRGAFTMIRRLAETDRRRGVIAHSSGNHGQAVAFAARHFGIPATVVMPTTAPRIKVDGVRRWGATVVFEGTLSSERHTRATMLVAEHGLTMIPPYDHHDVIAGQGTVGRELLAEWPDVDAVLVPVGGGGHVSGVAAWIKRAKPGCLVIGVEPEGSDVVRRSVAAGHPVQMTSTTTIADGLRSDRTGEIVLAHIRALVDEIVTVSDAAIERATALMVRDARVVVEYSGAVTVAALISGQWNPAGRRTAAIISGGNIDPRVLAGLLEQQA